MEFVLAGDTEVLETIVLWCILVLYIHMVGYHGALHDLFDLECENINYGIRLSLQNYNERNY